MASQDVKELIKFSSFFILLVSLLEMSNDEAQQKAIRNMLCEIAIYLNHEDDDEYTISGKCKKRA